ncbi:MAG: DUF2298 domain-containing protein [Methanomicrobiales archaeon]|nr:DUF2298 domain-containing protein [Methanomicrobiales archaeon]MDI6875831.1 DUF2298 domain-containing protein [Methanomicrobiales archaeon]
MIESQFLYVVSWLAVVKLLQIAVFPPLERAFPRFGYAIAYPASILLFTLGSWYLGLLALPIPLVLLPFAALLGLNLYQRAYSRDSLRENLAWDGIFLVGFLFMLSLRFVNPTISFAEKFMDHAFLASVMRSPVVPPLDPWYAGGTLEVYYYLGYWTMGCLGILSGAPSSVTFNLALPTVFALSAVGLVLIGQILVPRFRWLPVLALLLPNPSFFYHLLLGEGMQTVLWESTRTIANTINEYPFFSFLWGDVHPHVMSIFNQVFLLALLAYAYTAWGRLRDGGRWILAGLAALSLGSMPGINTWDVLIYAPITVLVGILVWRRYRETPRDWSAARFLLAVPPLAILLYLPFYLQLETQGIQGVHLVPTPSEPLPFLLVHGFFLAVFYLHAARDLGKRPYLALAAAPLLLAGYAAAAIAAVPLALLLVRKGRTLPEWLAVCALALTILCEVIYFRDNMGDVYYRMNTVFKCYVPAWLLMSVSAFSLIGGHLPKVLPARDLPIPCRRALGGIAVIGLLLLPFLLNVNFGPGTGTLDGLEYLEFTNPGDAEAIAFLRTLPVGDRIVEAEGGDYTYFSRISSFSGIPAVIGQPFHEHMWRGDAGRVAERAMDVRAIYERADLAVPLMRKYNATLLYVGAAERERYQVNIPESEFTAIYDRGGVAIYRLPY